MPSWFRKLSLRTVLIVPFVLQTVTAVGLVGYLSYKNGQQAVEDLAKQLMEEVGERISDRLDSYLATPQQVVAANRLAWQQGTLDITNLEEVRQQLWQQIKLNPSMTGIHFLNPKGETVGYGRILSQNMREVARKVSGKDFPIGTIYYTEAKNPAPTQRKFYIADSRGKPQQLVYPIKMNYRTLPWYVKARASRKQAWTPLVVYQAAPALGLFAVAPVYDRVSQLQAVFASDVNLADLGTFLNKLDFSRSGQAFIIDNSGNLAGTSTLEKPYVAQANSQPTLLSIFQSRDIRTREIAEQLKKRFGNFRNLQNTQQLSVTSQGEKLFVKVVPYGDTYGLDWLVVVAIPESDFMARINENTHQTILLCIVTLLVTAGIGTLTAQSIAQPILRLNAAAKDLSNGEFAGNIPVIGAKEVGELTESFNQMAQVLSEYNRSLETQVQERTEALQRSEAQINSFLAAAPVGMGIVNNQLRFVKINQVLASIANLKVEEKLGKNIREVVPEKIVDKIEPLYQQVLATGKPILNLETSGEVPSRPGIQCYWIVSYFPIFAADSSPDGVGVVVVDITERKHLEIALQEKTDELERFFSAALDLLCIADTDGYFRRLNVEWENILGYTLADLEGQRFLDFVHPDDLESTLGAIAELSQQRVVLNFTNRYRHRDGSYRWLEWRSLPIGKQIYAAARDITDRKRAEAELLESKRLIEQVTESTSAILYIFDLIEQRNVYINSQIERLLGYSPAEIQAMGSNVFPILMHPEDLPRVMEVHAGLPSLSDNELMEVEYRMRDKQGNWHWLYSRDRILTRTASGQPAQLLGTATDITDRKQIEAALRQSEERFQEIAQTIDQLFFVRSVSPGEFLYVNPAYEKIWGRSCESLYRDPQSWLEAIHPDDRPSVQSSLRQQFEGRSVKRGYRITRPDGEIRWIEAEISVVYDGARKPQRFVGFAEDITDRKIAEIALRESEQKFSTIFQASPDPLWIATLSEGCCLNVNDSFAKFLDYPYEEIIGKTCVDLKLWDKIEDLHRFRQLLTSEGKLENFEVAIRTRSRGARTVLMSATVSQINNQDCVIGLLKDITDRKQLQLALQTSEARLKSVLNNAPAFISGVRLIDNERWEYEYFSPGIEAICGYTGEEIAADYSLLLSLILPEDMETVVKPALARAFTPNFATTVEYRLRNKNGSIRWVANSISTYWDKTTQCWYGTGIIIDITDRKLAEQALQQIEFRLQQLAAASPGVIYTVVEYPDGPARYEYLSPAFEEIHEIPVAEALANAAITFNQIHLNDRQGYQQAVAKALETMQPFKHEWRIIMPSGKIKWIQANSRPLRRENGEIVWHGIVLDVTDRKRAEAIIQEREARLRLAMEVSKAIAWERDLQTDELIFSSTLDDQISRKMSYTEAFEQVHPDDLAKLHQANQEAIAQRGEFQIEHRVAAGRETDRWRWLQVNAKVLTDAAGKPTTIIGMSVDITDRKLAEEALSRSEARYQRLAATVPGMLYDYTTYSNGTDKFFYLSPRCRDILEIEPEAAMADSSVFWNLVYSEDIPKLKETCRLAIQKQTIFFAEFQIITTSGKMKWLQATATLTQKDSLGSQVTWSGIMLDVTARKLAEETLKITLARLQNLATAVPGNIYSLVRHPDGSWKFEYCNRGIEEITEIPLEQALENAESAIVSQIHPDDRSGYGEAVARSLETMETFKHQWRIITPSGKLKWLQGNSQPERRDNGDVVWHGIVLDITERKLVDETLRIMLNRVQNLATAMPGVLYSIVLHPDDSLEFEYINRAVEEIYEVSIGRVLADAEIIIRNQMHPEDRAGYLEALYRSRETLEIFRHEWRITTPSGKIKWLQANCQPERRENGDICWHGIVQDISDRKLAEAELSQAKEAAVAANRAKSTFLANMSHELRTPLNAVLGFAQLISQSHGLSPEDRENIAIINRSGEHLLTLINDVLDMAKIEAGRMTLNETKFNLYRLLDDLEKLFYLKAKDKKLSLNFDRDASVPEYVRTDEIKLRQVLINLISNAIKFTEAGQVTVRVRKKAQGKRQNAEDGLMDIDDGEAFLLAFEIEDTGVGIPEHELEIIFEPFLQTRTRKQSQEGTGLGLPISRRFIQLMGGNITVSSQFGCGSTFYFDIQFRLADRLSYRELNKQLEKEYNSNYIDIKSPDVVREKPVINPIDLAALPRSLIARLEQATIQASWPQIASAIDEIAAINPRLAEALKYLIEMFDYQEIVTAIKIYKSRENDK